MKKAKKTKQKTSKFPSISRTITEKFLLSQVLPVLKNMAVIFIFTSIFVFLLLVVVDLYKTAVSYEKIKSQRQKITLEINTLKAFSQKFTNYKEVYFQIAVREYELGNFNKANEYLQKALYLDPGYGDALQLQKEL